MSVKLSGLSSNLDTESIIKALVSAYSVSKDNLEKAQTQLSWTKDSWKAMNTKIYSFYSKSISNMKLTASYNKKASTISDATIAKVTSSSSSTNGTQSLEVNKLAASGYLTGGTTSTESTVGGVTTAGKATLTSKLSDIKGLSAFTTGTISAGIGTNTTNIDLTADMTVGKLVTKLKEAGVNASFDEVNQRFFVSAKSSGKDNDFTLSAVDASGTTALKSLGLTSDSAGAVRNTGTDAEIKLNGATFTSSTNNFQFNGLTIQALTYTKADTSVSITTDTDVDGIYKMVKDFFKGYNELINGMDAANNADSAGSYKPLTTDEKAAMTDTQIEAWEKKIKDSLLRKDSTLGGVINSLKTEMLGSFKVDDKSYSLSSFGINTLSYFTSADNEKGAYHIDGDTDDTNSSGNADKLRAAIASNPDAVTSFFTQLTSSVYTDLTKRMKSSSLRSAYTIYNDKQMDTEYSEYTTKIADQTTKISTMEDYYNRKFTAMESALSKLNSNTSALSSMLGS